MVVIRMFRAVPRRFGPAAHPPRRRSFASELTGVMGLPVDAAPAENDFAMQTVDSMGGSGSALRAARGPPGLQQQLGQSQSCSGWSELD